MPVDQEPAAGRGGAANPPYTFVGDLGDPWVLGIAESLPAGGTRVDAPGDLPDDLAPRGGVLVLHRAVLTRGDAGRLARLRAAGPARVVLCHGPQARYDDLNRWAELVDAAVPEATARDTLARHLRPAAGLRAPGGPAGPRPEVAVVGANAALRRALAEAAEAAGYAVSASVRDWADAPPTGPAVWDVPLLEPGWAEALGRRSQAGPVVALLGFADRLLVAEARARGAWACLELPVDLPDLAAALDRLPPARVERAHRVPPPPAASRRRRSPRAVAEPPAGD